MDYPKKCDLKVRTVFDDQDVCITLYSPLTIFIGANGLGKTQTLKTLRDTLRREIGAQKVRYLSSNRIGNMEMFRSKVNHFNYRSEDCTFGGKDEKQNRLLNETVTGDFFTLDEKKDVYIKVAERLSILFHRQIYIRWDAGNLKVFFGKTKTQNEYSAAAEASGLVNLISILSALYDNAVEALLVDEPEVSLHPQLQSFVLREMINASQTYNKTIILSTHSSYMIPFDTVECISNLVFFTEGRMPIQVLPDAPELHNRKLKEFIIRMSQTYKDGFFAKRIFLVEGASDYIICKFLLNKLDMYADVAGTQIIPVDGKGQFPSVVKLFRLIGKEVVVLTDLDGFTDDNSIVDMFCNLPSATEIANKQGVESISKLIRDVKTKVSELTSESKQESLRDVYVRHPYWKNKDDEADENKCIIRSMIAMLFSSDSEAIGKWPDHTEWLQLKTRLEVVFNDLELLGCYVLRRGAIESYYNYASSDTYDEKPSSALYETSCLQDKDNGYIYDNYMNIINALTRISNICVIDEGHAIRKELLSELALVIEVLPQSADVESIYAAIKQAKGNNSSLFSYTIIHENEKIGVKVDLKSTTLDVKGFPLVVFCGDNVNEIVSKNIVHS